MKEHRKHPPSIGYPGEGSQVQVDRHGNIRVSLRDKEKRKNLVRKPDWDVGGHSGSKMDDREAKRFKAREKERERSRREREEERIRLVEAARERDRRNEMKKMEKEKMRHRIAERERIARVKRVHEVSRDLTPIRSPIISPKSSSSRSLGEIRARTPSESPPRSKIRSIVRSLPKSPTLVQQTKSPILTEQKPIDPVESSSKPIFCGSVGSPDALSNFDNSESKSGQTILPAEDMSPISNSSSLGDIDANELNIEKLPSEDEENNETVKQNEDIISDENFSEWSEDEDELLNKPTDKSSPLRMEVPSEESITAPLSELEEKSTHLKEIDRAQSAEPSSSLKPSSADSISVESQDACSSLQDDALESISDDECDAITGLVEAQEANLSEGTPTLKPLLDQESIDDLDIDWSNLIQQPKPQVPDTGVSSARKRMLPANILSRIGFSQEYAGTKITEKLIDHCKDELKENFTPFRHVVAALHCFIGEQIAMREKLFESSNFFLSALSARKDLDIRKILAQTFVDFSYLQSPTLLPLESVISSSPQSLTSPTSTSITNPSNEPVLPSVSNSLNL